MKKTKVESSPHFEEIVTRLAHGESSRSVSKWLKETHDENISHVALARYTKKYISMEERVEAELNKRAQAKKKVDAQINDVVQEQVDEKETADNVNETVNTVAKTIANNMQGVAKVAADFPRMYEKVKRQASDINYPNVTYVDVAKLGIQANKLYADYFKQEENKVEINVTEGFGELRDAIRKSRKLLQEKD